MPVNQNAMKTPAVNKKICPRTAGMVSGSIMFKYTIILMLLAVTVAAEDGLNNTALNATPTGAAAIDTTHISCTAPVKLLSADAAKTAICSADVLAQKSLGGYWLAGLLLLALSALIIVVSPNKLAGIAIVVALWLILVKMAS